MTKVPGPRAFGLRIATLLAGAVLAALIPASCGAPPWRLGRPLDGRPSIPPDTGRPVHETWRQAARAARAEQRPVLETSALLMLDDAMRANEGERGRLAELLVARATAFRTAGRSIPESRDLENAARLDPGLGQRLVAARAAAAAGAGDAWKAIGAREEARAAHNLATRLGGAPPTGGQQPVPPPPARPAAIPPDIDGWLYAGPLLSERLLALAEAFPSVLDDRARALRWADLLLEEDPTLPDVLELVALIFGRAGRFGGTERMLVELAFHSPDRAAALVRGAKVWERLGRERAACAGWIRAARWRDDPEDPSWRRALTCARKDPGAGDWRAIRDYVVARAAAERREAIAAELEALVADGRRPSPEPTLDAGPASGEGGVSQSPDGGDAGGSAPADGGARPAMR